MIKFQRYWATGLSRILDALPVNCGNCNHLKCQRELVSKKKTRVEGKKKNFRLVARCKFGVTEKDYLIDRNFCGPEDIPMSWTMAQGCGYFKSMMD